MTQHNPSESTSDDDDTIIPAEAPEQSVHIRWQFRPRQQKKWGQVTREGVIVGRGDGRRVVPPDEVWKLAALGMSNKEIATWFDIKEDTLHYNFATYLAKAREDMKQRLRQAMWKNALGGNVVMQIFLAKNVLNMSDSPVNRESDQVLPWDTTE